LSQQRLTTAITNLIVTGDRVWWKETEGWPGLEAWCRTPSSSDHVRAAATRQDKTRSLVVVTLLPNLRYFCIDAAAAAAECRDVNQLLARASSCLERKAPC
jgi:hypothetical protein